MKLRKKQLPESLSPRSEAKAADPHLPCDGCAHSASGAPFPGHPSGERPCSFCVRNPNGPNPDILFPSGDIVDAPLEVSSYVNRVRQYKGKRGEGIWYDGTPAYKTPMDCYIATDRFQQQKIFDQLDRVETGDLKVKGRDMLWHVFELDEPVDVGLGHPEAYCCEGGPAPGGHAWTCICFLGISYG